MPIVATDLNLFYDSRRILKNLNFRIETGDFVGISGSNGSGKSSLSMLFNGIIPHHIPAKIEGSLQVGSKNPLQDGVIASTVAMVFQNPEFSLFNLTVKEEVLFGLKNLKLDQTEKRLTQALEIVGLLDVQNKDPQELSLGQKQRLSLACSLALDTPYLVLDEPSSMLDYRTSRQIYEYLKKINQQGKTIITIEHDTDLLAEFTTKTMLLEAGEIVAFDTTEKVFDQTELLKNLGIKVPRI